MDGAYNITSYYVYDGIGLVAKMTPSGTTYFYHYNGSGNTIAMTDASGNMVNKYAYDEFGNLVNVQETVPNPFLFVGQYGVMDDDNGLLHMRARYYDPQVGRFINKDPIGLEGGINLFAYVDGNPVNWVDPYGLQALGGARSGDTTGRGTTECGQKQCNQQWADCYTNCINALAPGFTEFFVGSQIAVNAPYNLVVRPGPGGRLIFRLLPHPIVLFYPRLWQAAATVSRVATPIQGVGFAWVGGVSYGCMISCMLDPCNY
jgi:RHS repeat-associated protein